MVHILPGEDLAGVLLPVAHIAFALQHRQSIFLCTAIVPRQALTR